MPMTEDNLTTYYFIMQWSEGEWKILHYTHDFDDFQKAQIRYPETDSIVHLINIKYCKAHEIFKQYRDKVPKPNG